MISEPSNQTGPSAELTASLKKTGAIASVASLIGGFFSDVLQPLAPFAWYLLVISSVAALALGAVSVISRRFRGWSLPGAEFAFLLGVAAGVVVALQRGEESQKSGFLAAKFPAVAEFQRSLGLIQKDVTEIRENTDEILGLMKLDPGILKAHYRGAAEKAYRERLVAAEAGGAGWKERERLRKEFELQLLEIDRFVEVVQRGFSHDESHPIYREAVRVLQEDGVDPFLAYLSSQESRLDALIENELELKLGVTEDVRNLLKIRRLQASTLQGKMLYDESIEVYESLIAADPAWIDPRIDLAGLLNRRAVIVDPAVSKGEVRRAEHHCRGGIAMLPFEERSEKWARLQSLLGGALLIQGDQASGDEARQFLEEAATAYRAALEVFTRETLPKEWADTRAGLGNALIILGVRTSGEEAQGFLDEAVTAYRAASEVYREKAMLQNWAATQTNLGNALQSQGRHASGEEARRLCDEAVKAYRAALDIYDGMHLPYYWAIAQGNLGNALKNQAEVAPSEEERRLLVEAVKAHRAALEVYFRNDLPQYRAKTRHNLGNALMRLGRLSSGVEARGLLDEAVAAYRASLEFFTPESLPHYWAMTQYNLSLALLDQGRRAEGEEARALLNEAAAAFRAALEIYEKEDLPQNWAGTQYDLGTALMKQGRETSGKEARALLAEAAAAFRTALEFYTQTDQPEKYVGTQYFLGLTLTDMSKWTSEEEKRRLLDEAAAAFRIALEGYDRKDQPGEWGTAQHGLGYVLWKQGGLSSEDRAHALRDEAVAAYRAALEALDPAEVPSRWASIAGDVSFILLQQRDFPGALNAAEEAARADPDSQFSIQINRAHALLYLGRFEEAKAIYLRQVDRDSGGESRVAVILDDFDRLERIGVTHADLGKMRSLLTAETPVSNGSGGGGTGESAGLKAVIPD